MTNEDNAKTADQQPVNSFNEAEYIDSIKRIIAKVEPAIEGERVDLVLSALTSIVCGAIVSPAYDEEFHRNSSAMLFSASYKAAIQAGWTAEDLMQFSELKEEEKTGSE